MADFEEEEPNHEVGRALAEAVRGDAPQGFETRRVREAARAGLFGSKVEGTKFDRYFVIALLGQGAMGSVYAAYDPKLDRKVALKILPLERPATDSTEATPASGEMETLVREARALAQVHHSNVVQVYDAGSFEGRVFLTMELIEGEDLRAWMTSRRDRPWKHVLPTLLQAGRGLAAVHAAGLVHRDFKPENILVGGDGVARVADFGLARADRTPVTEVPTRTEDVNPGTVGAGTPAYLAPERVLGTPADVRSDLYAFCVTAWEALAGDRPQRMGSRTAPSTLPRWLVRAFDRGLSFEPADRHASMDELLAELEAGVATEHAAERRRVNVRRTGILLGITSLIVLGSFGAVQLDRSNRMAACELEGAQIETLWPGREQAVLAGISSSGASFAPSTAELLPPHLLRWAAAWRRARTRACVEATVDRAMSPEIQRRAIGCLALRRAELEASLDLLAVGDRGAVQAAIESVTGIEPPDACLEPRRLGGDGWPTEEQWVTGLQLQERLALATSLSWAGDHEKSAAEAEAVLEEARDLGWPRLIAAAQLRLGLLHAASARHEDAESMLRAAYFTARRHGALDIEADAATHLAMTVGDMMARPAEGALWVEHARLALEQGEDPRRDSRLLHAEATLADRAGNPELAKQHYHEELQILEATVGPEHPHVGSCINNLANVSQQLGQFDEARTLQERSLEISEHAFGPDHPDVASSLNNLAINHLSRGAFQDAVPLLERSIEIYEASLGPDHPRLANGLINLALARQDAGQLDEAEVLLRRALGISEKALGAQHPRVALIHSNLGELLRARGDLVEARTRFESALRIFETALGPEHPSVGSVLTNLGMVVDDLGEHAEAVKLHQKALGIMEGTKPPGHPEIAQVLCNLGHAELALDEVAAARGHFGSCVKIFDDHPEVQPGEARARFFLAKATLASGDDRAGALALARRAKAEVLPAEADDAAQIALWLDEHE